MKTLEFISDKVNPQFIVIIGGLLTILGAYLTSVKSSKSNSENKSALKQNSEYAEQNLELSKENNKLSNDNKELIEQNLTFARLQQELTQQNLNLANKISVKADDISDYMSGGDSYCIMSISTSSDNTMGNLVFLLGKDKKNPLQNVQVRVTDLNTYGKQKIEIADIINSTYDIGNIYPDRATFTTIPVNLDKVKGVNLNMHYTVDNGFFSQALRMRFVKGKWLTASRVSKGNNNLFMSIDKDYPTKGEDAIFKTY